MALLRQFGLLLWKNYLLQKRKIIVTLFQVGIPTLFALILILIRQEVSRDTISNVTSWNECDITVFPKIKGLIPLPLPHRIGYTPKNAAVVKVMSRLQEKFSFFKADHLQGFDTEEEMVNFLMFSNSTYNNTKLYLGGIVFTNEFLVGGTKFPDNISYKIRLSSSPRNAGTQSFHFNPFASDTRWRTKWQFPLFQKVGPRERELECGGNPGYYREGFVSLQYAINNALFEELAANSTKDEIDSLAISMKRHPYPPYNDDQFVLVVQQQLPFIIMLSFILSALSIVQDITYEKEKKLKESMKMMGLSGWLHWLAWFVKYFLFLLISIFVMTFFFSVDAGEYGSVIGYTNPVILFIFLTAYAIASITFCFAVSVFFNKANSGAAAGGILFFCSYIPWFFIQPRYDQLTLSTKLATSLDFTIAVAYGSQVIGMFEGTGAGVQWSNFAQGVSVDDSLSMLHVVVMLLIDSVFYFLIAWYVEAVNPGEFGIPKPWYFPFLISYWCGTSPHSEILHADKIAGVGQFEEFFEKDPIGITAGVQIRNLKKRFGSGDNKKVAVAGMTLDMFEGQITALLGHNGAGKTTTMSMLTGFIPPTGGTAFVNGYDIRTDITNVRHSLGLCPQHDVLFDTLTVEEHLIFFAKLKGCPSDQVKGEVETMLQCINLKNKKDAQAKTLSGGMKRKLSVGIALIAGSKIVILDEPSSGLDPDARRQIWTMLQNNREGRTMLLSTHFMDEADLLGDRIAIMADGVVKCCGSSLFLKTKYGAGYHMIIVKDTNCAVDNITRLVTSYVPQAKMESNVGAELSYVLPQESSNRFEELFTELERNSAALGIQSYGASVTTMEEVFLRVGESRHETHDDNSQVESNTLADILPVTPILQDHIQYDLNQTASKNYGYFLGFQQFYAMFLKRAIHTLRNKIVTATQLIVPLFFTIIVLIVLKTFPGPSDSTELNLSVEKYRSSTVVYSTSLNATPNVKNMATLYGEQYKYDGDVTVTDVDKQKGFMKDPDIMKYLAKMGEEAIAHYNLHFMTGASFTSYTDKLGKNMTEAIAYFNNQGFHSPGISLGALANGLLKYFTQDLNYSLSISNHPLPRTLNDIVHDDLTRGTKGFSISINVMFGMAFLTSSFVLFLVKERAVKAKHIQFVSGLHGFNFWSSTFCWDMINYLVPCFLIVFTFIAFQTEAYDHGVHVIHIILLFFLHGCAILPFMYLCSFLFNVSSTAFVWLTMFNILAGIATVLAVAILSIPQLELQYISNTLQWVFLVILPHFAFGQALKDYYSNYEFLKLCEPLIGTCDFLKPGETFPCCAGRCGDECVYFDEDYLGWEPNGIGRHILFLALQSVVYFLCLFLLESGIFLEFWYMLFPKTSDVMVVRERSLSETIVQEDTDVATERARIANTSLADLSKTDSLILQELTKFYGRNLAVNHLSLGIPQGECFGLLGINGAGKTTTFKMLTGDETLSDGDARLHGFSVRHDIKQVQSRIGYCPQFDALIDQLTGRESLYMFARLRGIYEARIPGLVRELLYTLTLTEYADRQVQTYSGGNKRKLSAALALIGDPPIIFLDEPTTGMDPVARRFLWDALVNVRDSGRTLILTSHSMEECEALCTRLAIMVNGKFKCLGSQQHLKNKFGEGYTILAKVAYPEDGNAPDMQPLMTFIEEKFPGSELKDIHQGMVHYHVPNSGISWAKIFGMMERAKDQYHIEDYSVSQTTLEQVFINFARSQLPPEVTESKCCKGGCFSCCRSKSHSYTQME